MSQREIMSGNEAIAEAAIRAGCLHFYGYPITPQSEILEYMARKLPRIGGVFLQAESELAAIHMVYGVACTGSRVMTATSSPGISLMQEGISYLASAELPCVIVNVTRASPGLGRIPPAQSDYFQATKRGHGDHNLVVLAPASVQEMADLTALAFDLADDYRNPVILLTDGLLAQLMEPLVWREMAPKYIPKDWAIGGAQGRERRLIISAALTDEGQIELNIRLKRKYDAIREREQRWEGFYLKDAEVVVVAFGSAARIAQEAVEKLREGENRVGLIRPITLWPFPIQPFERCAQTKAFLTVEMNNGQMVEDVRLAVGCRAPVYFWGLGGGKVPTWREIEQEINGIVRQHAGQKEREKTVF